MDVQVHSKFKAAVADFTITVPEDYNSETLGKVTGYFASNEWNNATDTLVSGKTYRVRIFPVRISARSSDCLALLAEQKALLVSAQGLMLVYGEKPEEFPFGATHSFDKEHMLPWEKRRNDCVVPSVHRSMQTGNWCYGSSSFHEHSFGESLTGQWERGDHVLCITEA